MANTKTKKMAEHKYLLRLPLTLYKKIQKATVKEQDSINRFIVTVLECHLDNKGKTEKEILANTETIIQLLQEVQEPKNHKS